MSMFSSVDASDDPARAIWYLDQTTRAESGMKHYAMAAHALRSPNGFVLDVGCGIGHDLALLASAGISPAGVDASAVLLDVARERSTGTVPLLRAIGEALPFRDESIAGARIERVLMHVVDPSVVLAEVVRCLRREALLTVFEPDWDRFTVRTDAGEERCGWVCAARHPGVGGVLWELLEAAGCVVLDRVEELSVWRSLAVLDGTVGLERSIAHVVQHERISRSAADRWLDEQRARDALGCFYATMPKVLFVARRQE
jgi:SAM-dependent methyltransferase